MTLQGKLIRIGVKVVSSAQYVTSQIAEVAVPQRSSRPCSVKFRGSRRLSWSRMMDRAASTAGVRGEHVTESGFGMHCLAASRKQGLLAVAEPSAGLIKLLDIDTFSEVARSSHIETRSFDGLAWHPNEPILAVLTTKQFLVFETPSLRRIAAFPSQPYNSLAFSPDGSLLALGARPADTIELWDVRTRRRLRRTRRP